MALGLLQPAAAKPLPAAGVSGTAYPASIWQAPLVPVALAATAGIVADRYFGIALEWSLVTAVVGIAGWMATRQSRRSGLPLTYLLLACAAVAATYHHGWRNGYSADDIGKYASARPQPVVVRGVLEEEPLLARQPLSDPLRSFPRADQTHAVLGITQLKQRDDWDAASGRVRLIVTGELTGLHAGDEVQVVGRLLAPHPPANPGEFDHASYLQDQRIRALVVVENTSGGVTRLAKRGPRGLTGWLAVVRGWGQQTLQRTLPEPTSGVAMALLLGEGSTLTSADWEKYIRTGVVHVLVISGQHLAILAWFLWWGVKVLGVPHRWGALLIALFLLGYALLTGGRAPALRAAVIVCAFCGALFLRRPVLAANSFALAWLVVILLNPTEVFNTGCQVSFLAVAVLYWGTGRWFRQAYDPLERLVDQARPPWQKLLRWLGRQMAMAYLVTLAIWLAVAPLLASRYHLVQPAGLIIGPPVVLCSAIALVAGFLLLLAAAVCWPLVPLLAFVTRWSLAGCQLLVNFGDGLPRACWYVGDIPDWWLWGFYVGLLATLTLQPVRQHGRWAGLAGLVWLCLGLLSTSARSTTDELRCTFLAVGRGGCTVLETPDGRTLLYDAGAIAGPDVTRRQIAPFLWKRGIRRIDEVILSHADLDHFNGLPALLDRFSVGQVTCTPTFADKKTPGVEATLATLKQRGIAVRIVQAGDRLTAGKIEMEVLHPPAAGPKGNENARSLVLLVRHGGHTILLTGDLEGAGLDRVLKLPAPPVDILMAPHHGSRTAQKPERILKWVQPRVVVACQGPPDDPSPSPNPYEANGTHFLGTGSHGAITVRSRATGLVIETFATGSSLTVR